MQGFSDKIGRLEVPCATDGRTAVLLAFGQSNAGNRGNESDEIQASKGVLNFNFQDGKCYQAADPLLGNVGEGASVWTRVGQGLIEEDHYDRVIIVPFAVGGSVVADWAPGGRLQYRLRAVLNEVRHSGLAPTFLLWHQGEHDGIAKTSEQQYAERFQWMVSQIRADGITAPIIVAQATICRNEPWEPVRKAQRDVVNIAARILAGPDTDALVGEENRPDGCHLRGKGLEAHARLWLDAINRN